MDNLDEVGAERQRISHEQEHEVRYWTQTLGVTKEQLTEAVRVVGPMADRVRQFLAEKRSHE